jgi:KamA family protein
MASLILNDAPRNEIREAANEIRMQLNPHPADQKTLNVPALDGEVLAGLQHKYRETVLFFPAAGQTCHAYCTFCFRWAQFVGMQDMRFASKEADGLKEYVQRHPEVTNILFTGGDPMVMKTHKFQAYVDPLLDPSLEHLHSIRIGTKSVAYWPQRFVTDPDADDLLRYFERIVDSGRSVAIMAHYNHYRELDTPMAREAVRRIRDTGAVIRSQSPLLRYINDSPSVWELMWREQVRLGIIPYYMFVERDTGAKEYFKIPLARALKIFREAHRHISGLGRTVRGPSMSATPGKVEVTGITEVNGEKVFVLRFLQGRSAEWVGKPFFAKFDPEATWLNELKPAFGASEFFYEAELRRMREKASAAGA